MNENENENGNGNTAISPVPAQPKPRHRLRLAAIGGIAAVAILGGGISAVASADEPTSGASTTPVLSTQTLSTVKDDSGSGAASAATPPTPKPHLDGTVTSVSGSTVLIKDREGFTRTIVLSSKTTYDDGLKAALATGTKIHAEGTVDANGTSLDATTVGADKGPTGAPGGGRGGPKGGPGRDGDHPGPPTGGPDGKGPDGKSPAASTAPTGTKSGSATTAPSTSSSAQPTK